MCIAIDPNIPNAQNSRTQASTGEGKLVGEEGAERASVVVVEMHFSEIHMYALLIGFDYAAAPTNDDDDTKEYPKASKRWKHQQEAPLAQKVPFDKKRRHTAGENALFGHGQRASRGRQ